MKAVVVAIATIALTACATLSEEPNATTSSEEPIATSTLAGEDKIRPSCEEKWSGDWAMIAYCFERQWAGYRRMNP